MPKLIEFDDTLAVLPLDIPVSSPRGYSRFMVKTASPARNIRRDKALAAVAAEFGGMPFLIGYNALIAGYQRWEQDYAFGTFLEALAFKEASADPQLGASFVHLFYSDDICSVELT
jgi:hypothetical protein